MINLPIEIGDVLLTGKFKNKRVTVKEIGVDEHGLPTVNGRGILKVRLEKLMEKNKLKSKIRETVAVKPFARTSPTVKVKEGDGRWNLYLQTINGEEQLSPVGYESKELAKHAALTKGYVVDGEEYEFPETVEPIKPTKREKNNPTKPEVMDLGKEKEIKLESANVRKIKRMIREVLGNRTNLREYDVEDPTISALVDEVSELDSKLTQAMAELEALKKKLGISDMEKRMKQLLDDELDTVLKEMEKANDRLLRTENTILTVKRWATQRETKEYKSALEYMKGLVNNDVRKMVDRYLESNKTFAKIKGSYGFTKRTESLIAEDNIFSKLTGWFKSLIVKFKQDRQAVDVGLNRLERMLSK